jgi:hypothetical protein
MVLRGKLQADGSLCTNLFLAKSSLRCAEKSKENSMSSLLRAILALLICLTWPPRPSVAWAHDQSGSRASNNGEIAPAGIQAYNPIRIDTKVFVRVSESILATPEPVSLALFGSGLALIGVLLLRCSRREKPFKSPRDVHCAVDKRSILLARRGNGAQHPRPGVPAPEPLVSTYVSSGAR